MSKLLIVTTSLNPSGAVVKRALEIAAELDARFVERHGIGVATLLLRYEVDAAVVVRGDKVTLHDGATEYFYHPNMLLVRAHNLKRGQRDLYVDAADFREGERVLDCTLGFGCEASLAAISVGSIGEVIGLESEPALEMLSRRGMAEFRVVQPEIREAMRRVKVVRADYLSYLTKADSGSFDVVYLDPFFEQRTIGSEHSVSPLVAFGNPAPLDIRAIAEAQRVARRIVIVKHPRFAELPDELLAVRSDVVSSRKGVTVYSRIQPFALCPLPLIALGLPFRMATK